MYGTSDIADWTLVEALGMSIDPRAVPSADQIKQMWNCSPISRSLPSRVPPHLFLLGQKDRRVPVSQGIHMAERLKQAGVSVYAFSCIPKTIILYLVLKLNWIVGFPRSICLKK